jgi:hypothetical protein
MFISYEGVAHSTGASDTFHSRKKTTKRANTNTCTIYLNVNWILDGATINQEKNNNGTVSTP